MQISTKYGFAFLCTPKCASTSIEYSIENFCNINPPGQKKHIDAKSFAENILSAHKILHPHAGIESFCIIREPLDWVGSWYRFRSRVALSNPKHPNHIKYTGNISYNEFIEAFISEEKRPPFARFKTQYNFMTLANGDIGVDQIIPMDRLDLACDFLSKKIGEEITIQKYNTSPKAYLNLDGSLEKRLRQYLSKDIVLYGIAKKYGLFNKALHSEELFSSIISKKC